MRETGGGRGEEGGNVRWEAKGIWGERRKGLGWHEGETTIQKTFGAGGGGRSKRIDRPDAQKSIEWMRRIRRIQGNLRETAGAFKLQHATMNGGLQLKPSPAGYE